MVTRRDPTADAALKTLREASNRGEPWLTRHQVAEAAGLSDGQAQAALGALAVEGVCVRGLFDDGVRLTVRWRLQIVHRPRGTAVPKVETVEAAE
jgi:hypothetical protein